jgi:hypothetical protein
LLDFDFFSFFVGLCVNIRTGKLELPKQNRRVPVAGAKINSKLVYFRAAAIYKIKTKTKKQLFFHTNLILSVSTVNPLTNPSSISLLFSTCDTSSFPNLEIEESSASYPDLGTVVSESAACRIGERDESSLG